METLKSIFEFVAVAGIVLALVAGFLLKSKKIRITSLALALPAVIGVWAIERFAKYPITDASASITLLFRGGEADKDWTRSGFGNESTVELFKNDSCLLKLASLRTSARGLEKGLSVFRNEYSLSISGSYLNADFEDMDGIDSIVVFDPGFRPPVELIDGRLELWLNRDKYYEMGVDRITCNGQRLKIGKTSRYSGTTSLYSPREKPAGKTDFGNFTLRDEEIAGTWIGNRTYTERQYTYTSILTAEMKENHTYTTTLKVYVHPLELEYTQYAEAGFWKADKGGIQVIPGNCQESRDNDYDLIASFGLVRIPCDRKHAMAFGFSGDALDIVTLTDGKSVTFPVHKL